MKKIKIFWKFFTDVLEINEENISDTFLQAGVVFFSVFLAIGFSNGIAKNKIDIFDLYFLIIIFFGISVMFLIIKNRKILKNLFKRQ